MEARHTSLADQYKRHQPRLPKKLIVCCDGTWLDRDNGWKKGHLQNVSNVTRIARAMMPEDDAKHPQIVFYQAGVGTGLGLYDKFLGGGTGIGLSENIREAYAFLGSNYSTEDGLSKPDSIFLLGFSRGAFTARSLGGLIAAVGVLTRKAMPFFYDCFADWEHAGDAEYTPRFIDAYCRAYPDEELEVKKNQPADRLARIKEEHGIDSYMFAYRKHLLSLGLTQEVQIKGIGVWDTVGALGVPINPILQRLGLPSFIRQYSWYDTRLSDVVENAFQALAIDEHRAPYTPAVWELDEGGKTNLKQVWFPGAHSNIGGSYEDCGIANITLSWMMDQLSGNTRDPSRHFEPLDWIKFDEEYAHGIFAWTSRWYEEQPDRKPYGSFAMGKLYDSNTFPTSLAGAATRTPGLYRETDYDTGKQKNTYLRRTNEYIHSSVRARIDLAGREVEPKSTLGAFFRRVWRTLTFQNQLNTYQPQRRRTAFYVAGPLHGWRLMDGHGTHREPNYEIDVNPEGIGEVHWKYEGKRGPPKLMLKEDVFAKNGFEEKLLLYGDDDAVANKIIFSNNKWQIFKKPVKGQVDARTF